MRVREKGEVETRGESAKKTRGGRGKGRRLSDEFWARGHCGAGAWPRRRSKRKIDAVRGDEKQRARRDGGPAKKKREDG